MTKVYLVMKLDCNGDDIKRTVVNVFTNKKKARSFVRWRNSISEPWDPIFYTIDFEIDTEDYTKLL